MAYRLSESGRRRLHLNPYRSPSLVTVRHQLDGVEFVTGIHRQERGLVQLWWPESMIPNLGDAIHPDQLVIIDTGEASALFLVEVDESTERPPVIRERLNAYAKMFAVRHAGWYLIWVVNSPARLARLRQIAAPMEIANLTGRCWGVPIGEVSKLGGSAQVVTIGENRSPTTLRSLATDPKSRRTPYPVGSDAWIQLLADDGLEDVRELWYGVERKPAGSSEKPESGRADEAENSR